MIRNPNAQYNVAKADSFPVKIASKQRKKMLSAFKKSCFLSSNDTVLDVGVTSDISYESSNYLEAWLSNKEKITAVGIDDAAFLESLYPGVKFIRADGLELPFKDQTFDVVHSSAVIEHVGSFDRQVIFISECARACKRFFYITTPNRFFPIEFHTILPLVHWLPKKWFRYLMNIIGQSFFR
jgi:ubiquinone/menaquinone biosynthesis C-methylase UbiE